MLQISGTSSNVVAAKVNDIIAYCFFIFIGKSIYHMEQEYIEWCRQFPGMEFL